MAAAAQDGFCVFKGASGKTYVVMAYFSDIAGALVNFDAGGGASATSATYWTAPENCVLVDVGIHSGMTDTTNARLTKGGQPTPTTIIYAAHLDTSVARPQLSEGYSKGVQIGMIQLA